MVFLIDVLVLAIIIVAAVVITKTVRYNINDGQKLKRIRESRDFYRAQLDIARTFIQTEKDLNNSGAELALMEMNQLQREYEDKRELTD